jgi:hypothetical protein
MTDRCAEAATPALRQPLPRRQMEHLEARPLSSDPVLKTLAASFCRRRVTVRSLFYPEAMERRVAQCLMALDRRDAGTARLVLLRATSRYCGTGNASLWDDLAWLAVSGLPLQIDKMGSVGSTCRA